MAKPKRRRTNAPTKFATPQPIAASYSSSPMRSVSRGAFNADERLKVALLNEASFLRSTGFRERGDTLETAANSIGLASAERILADLRA
jgi:hypothetical protein